MKIWYFTAKHKHWRNGTTVAMTAGVVKAASEDEAEAIIFKNVSPANAFDLHLTELKADDTCLTDYIPAAVFK